MDRPSGSTTPTVASFGDGDGPSQAGHLAGLSSQTPLRSGTAGVDAGPPRRARWWRVSELSVRQRLTTHSLLLMAVPLVVAVVVGFTTLASLIADGQERELQRLATALEVEIEASAARASTLATGLATTPAIAEAFATRDREALAAEVLPTFEQLQQEHGVEQLHFHDPSAISFLRAHEPDQFGDDLSGFRPSIVAANEQRALVTGLESGRFGLGLRGIAPVSWEGEHVGTLGVGNSFGSDFFEGFAAGNDVQTAFYLVGGQDAAAPSTYASTIGDQLPVGADALEEVLAGEPLLVDLETPTSSLAARFDPVLNFSGEPIGVAMVAVSTESTQALFRNEALKYAALTIVLLLAGGFAASMFARDLSRPLEAIRGVLARARQGDLTDRVDVERGDEIGAIGQDVNDTLDRLMRLMDEVGNSAQTLAAAADEMSTVSEQLEANATETAKEAVVVTDSARDVSDNVDAIASASHQMSAAIGEIAENASTVSDVAGRGVIVTDETVAAMEALSRSSQEIEAVVTLISEIAGQTHLLALNANIEAARAGESGRAFAVVANEIGTLARRTAAESETIAERIRDIRHHTSTSIDCMGSVSETMHEISGLQSSIAASVEEQSATTAEIGRAVTGAAQTTAAIAASVELVSERVDETRQAAGNSSSAAVELRTVAAGLHSSISFYTGS